MKHLLRRVSMYACVLAIGLSMAGCCGGVHPEPLDLAPPSDLPDAIHFRTRTETFNGRYFFVLRENRIWYKERPKEGDKPTKGGWKLLGPTGQPAGCHIEKFPAPTKIVSISADGIHLQALSDKKIFYRGDNAMEDLSSFTWYDSWGWPASAGPGLKTDFGLDVIWDVGDSFPFYVKTTQDGNGTKHNIGLGVAHIYQLDPGGKKIYFNDWWLPADWSRQACGPRRGSFQSVQMSVSGSTIFLINQYGEMYTRVHDFDASGENPLLTYTFVDDNPEPHVRRLPLHDWRAQPAITGGSITSRITIIQTGEGDASRELRVEGEQGGKSGYFRKAIFDKSWTFVETGHTIKQPFLQTRPANDPVPPAINEEETILAGTIKKEHIDTPLQVRIKNFHVVCSPAQMVLLYKGKPVTANGKELVLSFHHVHTMVTYIREREFWKTGKMADLRAGLILPKTYDDVDDKEAKAFLQRFFGDLKVINFHGTASQSKLSMKELTIWDMYRAPDKEKGFTSRFAMELNQPK